MAVCAPSLTSIVAPGPAKSASIMTSIAQPLLHRRNRNRQLVASLRIALAGDNLSIHGRARKRGMLRAGRDAIATLVGRPCVFALNRR